MISFHLRDLSQRSNTALRPGVQRPAIAILPNIHKFRDIKPKKACHQLKRPGQINVAENLYTGNPRVGTTLHLPPGAHDQRIPEADV
jgi:hypothetical protein